MLTASEQHGLTCILSAHVDRYGWTCTACLQNQPTNVVEVQAVRVVAGQPLEECVAVLGCAKARLDGLACTQIEWHQPPVGSAEDGGSAVHPNKKLNLITGIHCRLWLLVGCIVLFKLCISGLPLRNNDNTRDPCCLIIQAYLPRWCHQWTLCSAEHPLACGRSHTHCQRALLSALLLQACCGSLKPA